MKERLINLGAILLLLSIGLNLWLWFNPRKETVKGDTVYLPSGEKSIVYTLPEGNQAITTKVNKEYQKATEAANKLLSAVKSIPDLEDANKIVSLTAVNAKLELALSEKDMVMNDKDKQLKEWKDKYNSVKIDNEKNTASVISEVSPKIAVTEKRERFLSPKEQFTTVTSENESIKFYGSESYTFKNPKQKDIAELNLTTQGLFIDGKAIPFGGLDILGNPDGKVKYIGSYGYYWDSASQKFKPYILGGFKFNLIRF